VAAHDGHNDCFLTAGSDCSSVNGVVRAVYAITDWERDPSGRWAFTGDSDPQAEHRFLWHNVHDRLGKGDQNPIRYVGC
jgi:hypothetical protein